MSVTIASALPHDPLMLSGRASYAFPVDGTLIVVYFDGTNLVYRLSTDGGVTWSAATTIRALTGITDPAFSLCADGTANTVYGACLDSTSSLLVPFKLAYSGGVVTATIGTTRAVVGYQTTAGGSPNLKVCWDAGNTAFHVYVGTTAGGNLWLFNTSLALLSSLTGTQANLTGQHACAIAVIGTTLYQLHDNVYGTIPVTGAAYGTVSAEATSVATGSGVSSWTGVDLIADPATAGHLIGVLNTGSNLDGSSGCYVVSWNGSAWAIDQTVATRAGTNKYRGGQLAGLANGDVWLSYDDVSGGGLMLLKRAGGTWGVPVVTDSAGRRSSLTIPRAVYTGTVLQVYEIGTSSPWVLVEVANVINVAIAGEADGTGAPTRLTLGLALTAQGTGAGTGLTLGLILRRVGTAAATALTYATVIQGTAAGVGAASLPYRNAIQGTLAGTGGPSTALTYRSAIQGVAQGSGASLTALQLATVIQGTASGTGTATKLTTSNVIAGTASGTSAGTTLALTNAVQGTAVGTGAGVALTYTSAVQGTASGTGAATALTPTVTNLTVFITGEADGRSAGVALTYTSAVQGTAAGTGTATLTYQAAITGTAAGTGGATRLTLELPLRTTGTAAGTALTLTQAIQGTAAGMGAASALTLSNVVQGTASGTGAATRLTASNVLAGQASGSGAASTLAYTSAVQGTTSGTGAATALRYTSAMQGTASGTGVARLTLGLILTVQGTGAGGSLTYSNVITALAATGTGAGTALLWKQSGSVAVGDSGQMAVAVADS